MRKFSLLSLVLIMILLLSSCATLSKDIGSVFVSGTGTVALTADLVTFNVSISEIAPTTKEAQQEANKKIAQVLEIVRNAGVEDKDISTTALNFYTETHWENGTYLEDGDCVSQSIYIKVRNLYSLAPLIDNLGSSVSGISVNSVSFDSSKRAEAQMEARALAYENALQKALVYGEAANVKIGNPISITEGSSSYSNTAIPEAKLYASAAVADSYGTETPTGTLSVSASVQVEFKLN